VTPGQGINKAARFREQKRAARALLWLEISSIIAHGKDCVCSRLDTYRKLFPSPTVCAVSNSCSVCPTILRSAWEAVCSLWAKKVPPANWYESKDRASGAGMERSKVRHSPCHKTLSHAP
jgi:hypothetical protein